MSTDEQTVFQECIQETVNSVQWFIRDWLLKQREHLPTTGLESLAISTLDIDPLDTPHLDHYINRHTWDMSDTDKVTFVTRIKEEIKKQFLTTTVRDLYVSDSNEFHWIKTEFGPVTIEHADCKTSIEPFGDLTLATTKETHYLESSYGVVTTYAVLLDSDNRQVGYCHLDTVTPKNTPHPDYFVIAMDEISGYHADVAAKLEQREANKGLFNRGPLCILGDLQLHASYRGSELATRFLAQSIRNATNNLKSFGSLALSFSPSQFIVNESTQLPEQIQNEYKQARLALLETWLLLGRKSLEIELQRTIYQFIYHELSGDIQMDMLENPEKYTNLA